MPLSICSAVSSPSDSILSPRDANVDATRDLVSAVLAWGLMNTKALFRIGPCAEADADAELGLEFVTSTEFESLPSRRLRESLFGDDVDAAAAYGDDDAPAALLPPELLLSSLSVDRARFDPPSDDNDILLGANANRYNFWLYHRARLYNFIY